MRDLIFWQNQRWAGLFYSSSNDEVSITDKMQICKFLGISSQSYFSVAHEAIDSLQLPKKPRYTNEEGRRYWT
jgi:hypothetical protein